jgi:hypothetical protein
MVDRRRLSSQTRVRLSPFYIAHERARRMRFADEVDRDVFVIADLEEKREAVNYPKL